MQYFEIQLKFLMEYYFQTNNTEDRQKIENRAEASSLMSPENYSLDIINTHSSFLGCAGWQVTLSSSGSSSSCSSDSQTLQIFINYVVTHSLSHYEPVTLCITHTFTDPIILK